MTIAGAAGLDALPGVVADGDIHRWRSAATADEASARQFFADVEAARREAGSKVLRLLVDVRPLRSMAGGARRECYRSAPAVQDVRVAILGCTPWQAIIINFLLLATGHRDGRYFTSEENALAWLRRDDPLDEVTPHAGGDG